MKNRLFNDKKGINDISILSILIFIFVGIGIILPFINSEFGENTTTFTTGKLADDLINEKQENVSSIGAGDILVSVGKMFFWTFGDLPFWMDAIFLVLRILFLVILIRNFVPFLGGG